MNNLNEAAATDTFKDFEKMFWKHVWAEHRRTGVPIDDLYSDALLAFAKAFKHYNKNKGASFRTWLWNNIRNEHRESARVRARARSKVQIESDYHNDKQPISDLALARRDFNITQWLTELSEDAAAVAKMALEPPPDVRMKLRRRPGGVSMLDWTRDSIADFLLDLGWSAKRIFKAYAEIGDALT